MTAPHTHEDPARRCLQVDAWPELDQRAWEAALEPGDILDGTVGAGFHWAAETREKYRKGYGRWLTFLTRTGFLDPNEPPAARATPERVRAYIAELNAQNVGSWTLWGRLAELLAALKGMDPQADLAWLRKLVRAHERQTTDRRNKPARLRPPSEIFHHALERLQSAQAKPRYPKDGVPYRDALIVAILSVCPVRLGNLSSIEIDKHLRRTRTGYLLRFEAGETKTAHPFAAPLPEELTPLLEHYLTVVRPVLLQGRESPRLWVTRYGVPMRDKAVYAAVTRETERALGQAINPHLFRDCAATFVAHEDPEHIGIAAPILGHVDPRVTERHYIQANQIAAGRRIRQSVTALRESLSPSASRRAP